MESNSGVEIISDDRTVMAIILRSSFNVPGVHFFTPADLSQQLGYMNYSAGKRIEAHVHNPVPRTVQLTGEVLIIRKGKLRVDLYEENNEYVESRILNAGDTILLIAGGHGFEVLEAVEMIEIRQGPYL